MSGGPEVLALGNVSPEAWAPAVRSEGVLPSPVRDNVGLPDFNTLVARLISDTRPVEEIPSGFAAYQDAGGEFSKGLYRIIMDGVIELQKPGVRENINFSTGTEYQIKDFEDRYNKPFLGIELPPEKQIFLAETQKDAYRLIRGGMPIPDVDRKTKAYYSDVLVFEQILEMPGLASPASLEAYRLSRQVQPQSLPAAA